MAGELTTQFKVLNQFLDKSDGRDKLLATVQYAAMFISAGQPGDVKKIQASVATARKVFRIMRPLEVLYPLAATPSINKSKPLVIELLGKLKPLLMAIYFGGDHVVWAQQAGLLSKERRSLVDRAQKASLYGWFGGSLCTVVQELYELAAMTKRKKEETEEGYRARLEKVRADINRRLLVLIHACVQGLLAMGLLELRPWKPRTVGFLGVVASAMNCYMLYPSRPTPVAPAAAPSAAAPSVPAPPRPVNTKAA